MSLLVVDVGTSSVRAAIVTPDARVGPVAARPLAVSAPSPGLVEVDAAGLADAALDAAREALRDDAVEAVGVASQRATTVLWERSTGRPVGPAIGWQDLRTVGRCLRLQAEGVRLAPNAAATKLEHLLDRYDPDRSRDLAFGTVDSWLAWTLTEGRRHVTDATNAGATGLVDAACAEWNADVLAALRIPAGVLPRIVDSAGLLGECTALPGAPPLAALAGDQQASLIGQACVRPGQAKATFGTGAMLDAVTGPGRSFPAVHGGGCFPIAAWRRGGTTTWGVEAIMLAAGSCVDWLREDLELVASAAETAEVAGRCADSGGVWFVPALAGLGSPYWDHGARGTLLGVTRGSGRPQIVRAVLEGIAHRGADLLEAAEAGTGLAIDVLRIDGGMSVNEVFVQALADAAGRPVEVSPVAEATTLGAAYLAGLAVGTWRGEDDIAASWMPARVGEPKRALDRDRWREAVSRARGWLPELSGITF